MAAKAAMADIATMACFRARVGPAAQPSILLVTEISPIAVMSPAAMAAMAVHCNPMGFCTVATVATVATPS